MDLQLTTEQEEFRRDVCALLCDPQVAAEVEQVRRLTSDVEPCHLDVYRRLGARGWLAPNWPAQYGGLDRSIEEKAIVTEELIAHGVPDIVHTLSIDIVGLALNLFGTSGQRQRWLPQLAAGESIGCVLLSEPDVGSDLPALATRADPVEGGWRLHGRKLYNVKTHCADIGLCAARTSSSENRYDGITVFIVPLRTPGVTVRRVPSVSDDGFCEVTFSGLVMTQDDVLGEVGAGWQVLNRTLPLERTGVEFEARARRELDALIQRCEDDGALADSVHAERLVELDADVRAGRLLTWRALSRLQAGHYEDVAYPMAKWHTTETARSIAVLASQVHGLDGALAAWDKDAPPGWMVEADYRDAPGYTLAAGTSEVMLSLIAADTVRQRD
ncbi:MAG: acyl-CoA dehydrogenase family protein [Frankiaceae bacterium]